MKKVLRAIGGFFVKIGRWIANTAWVQPLLIVGGIFAVIFSIPYIKKGIENAIAANKKDEDLIYFQDRKLSLTDAETGESEVDKLLTYLEKGEYESAKADFSEKFFLSFVDESCAACKSGLGGFQYLENNFSDFITDNSSFKLYTIFVDTTNDDGDYLLKKVFINHEDFFDDIVSQFGENEDYPLLKNIETSEKTSLISSITSLGKAVTGESDLETPTTFLFDLSETGKKQESFINGVSALFFNYTTLTEAGENDRDRAKFLSNCWSYSDVFSPDFKK